jgi:signal peptidase I
MTNKKLLKNIYYPVGIFLLIIIFIKLFFPVYNIASDSMTPTINKGEYIVVNKLHYLFSEPKKNDIVLFEPIEDYFDLGPWIHRIIAIEGDAVSIENEIVKINGKEPLFPKVNNENLMALVKKGFVFQKGDNQKTIIGLVEEKEIIGKVLFSF